jgi:hypothetical protein
MRWACLLTLLLLPACKSTVAVSNQGMCASWSLADVRIGLTYCSAGSREGGVEIEHSKEAASKHFMHAVETVLPEIVDTAVKAALISAGIGAAGSAASCLIPSGGGVLPEEVPNVQ